MSATADSLPLLSTLLPKSEHRPQKQSTFCLLKSLASFTLTLSTKCRCKGIVSGGVVRFGVQPFTTTILRSGLSSMLTHTWWQLTEEPLCAKKAKGSDQRLTKIQLWVQSASLIVLRVALVMTNKFQCTTSKKSRSKTVLAKTQATSSWSEVAQSNATSVISTCRRDFPERLFY